MGLFDCVGEVVVAHQKWGPGRAYTYIDPAKVKSRNPGWCFKVAGWSNVRRPDGSIWLSADGKHLLEKTLAGDPRHGGEG